MLVVRFEHESPPATELQTFADDAEREVTWALVVGTSERTSWLAVQEVEHGHRLAVRLAFHEEVVHRRFGHVKIWTASRMWQLWHLSGKTGLTSTAERQMRCVVFVPLNFWWFSWIRSNPGPGAMSFCMHQLLSYVHRLLRTWTHRFCSILQCSYLDTIPWRTATCCPLQWSRSLLSTIRRCLVPPTPSSSRSCDRSRSAPPRRPLYIALHRQTSDWRNRELDCRGVPLDHICLLGVEMTADLLRTNEFELVVHAGTCQHSFQPTDDGRLLSVRRWACCHCWSWVNENTRYIVFLKRWHWWSREQPASSIWRCGCLDLALPPRQTSSRDCCRACWAYPRPPHWWSSHRPWLLPSASYRRTACLSPSPSSCGAGGFCNRSWRCLCFDSGSNACAGYFLQASWLAWAGIYLCPWRPCPSYLALRRPA